MTKESLWVGLDEEQYRQLELIAHGIGLKSANEGARFAINFFILWNKNVAIRASLNDETEFDKIAATTFKKLYGVELVEAAKETKK